MCPQTASNAQRLTPFDAKNQNTDRRNKRRYRPPVAWVRDFLRAARDVAGDFGGRDLATLLWALAQLCVRPGAKWLETVVSPANRPQVLAAMRPQVRVWAADCVACNDCVYVGDCLLLARCLHTSRPATLAAL